MKVKPDGGGHRDHPPLGVAQRGGAAAGRSPGGATPSRRSLQDLQFGGDVFG